MKRVIIGEKCIGCGICLHNKKYIEETTDGIARAIPGMTSPTFRLIMTIRKKHFPPGTTQTRLSGNASRTMSMMKTSAA